MEQSQARKGDWKLLSSTEIAQMHRPGWPGVWDAIIAWITRSPRRTAAMTMTASVWVKPVEGGLSHVCQLEVGPQPTPFVEP